MVEYHPVSAQDLSRLQQFGAKVLVLRGILLGYVLYAGRIWKRDILVADIEELEKMDASELYARRLDAKEVSTPMKGEKFIFSVADGTVKKIWRRSGSETIHLDQGSSWTGRGTRSFSRRMRSVFFNFTTRLIMVWWWSKRRFLVSLSGDFIYRHHVEHRVKLYVPTEESFLIPLTYWRYQNYWNHVRCDVGENIEDYWNVHGDRQLSDTWTDFTRFTILSEKPADGYTWSGETLTRKQTTRHIMARNVETCVWCIKTLREATGDYRETKAR